MQVRTSRIIIILSHSNCCFSFSFFANLNSVHFVGMSIFRIPINGRQCKFAIIHHISHLGTKNSETIEKCIYGIINYYTVNKISGRVHRKLVWRGAIHCLAATLFNFATKMYSKFSKLVKLSNRFLQKTKRARKMWKMFILSRIWSRFAKDLDHFTASRIIYSIRVIPYSVLYSLKGKSSWTKQIPIQ